MDIIFKLIHFDKNLGKEQDRYVSSIYIYFQLLTLHQQQEETTGIADLCLKTQATRYNYFVICLQQATHPFLPPTTDYVPETEEQIQSPEPDSDSDSEQTFTFGA